MVEELFPKGGAGADPPFTPEQLVQEGVPSGAGNVDAEPAAPTDDEPPSALEGIVAEVQQIERESSSAPPEPDRRDAKD